MRLLVVDDEEDLREIVRIALREEGYAVDTAADAAHARLLTRTESYDAIVLDVRLPDGNGMQIASDLRRDGIATPVLMLTAQRAPREVVMGLDAGADDYLAKPFELGELKARVRALLRRGGATQRDQLACGDLVVNRLTRQALAGGNRLTLTAKEFATLEYLAVHAEEVVTRTQLLEHVWERNRDPDSNVIDAHVARVRRKLKDARPGPNAPRPRITTVRGVGFMLTAG